MKTAKSLFLFLMVIICVYLSSQVWLQIPDFLSFNKKDDTKASEIQDIDKRVWEIVRPNKYIINDKESLREFYLENETLLWQNALASLEVSLSNFSESQTDLRVGEFYPDEYVMMEFENKLPTEIFTGKFQINKDNIRTKLHHIKKIVFGLNDPNSIYLYNGDSTVIIKNSKINNLEIYNNLKEIKESDYIVYKKDIEIDGIKIPVPIPDIKSALNPIYVKSEIDIKNRNRIEDIARDYFKNTYDYVRRSEDIERGITYVYKNEKKLKISPEGLIDFFNSDIDIENANDIYKGFLEALKFAANFLNIHEDMYLSDVRTAQHDRSVGYNFIFTYKIKNKPILFSKFRESAALEVIVVGNSVASYKRLIRDIDNMQDSEMKEEEIKSFEEVLRKQIIIDEDDEEINIPRVIDKSMVEDIDNVYLAYFDYARAVKEQQLRVVWAIKINDRTYVFNAITGNLVE